MHHYEVPQKGRSASPSLAYLGLSRLISSHVTLFILPAEHYSSNQPNKLKVSAPIRGLQPPSPARHGPKIPQTRRRPRPRGGSSPCWRRDLAGRPAFAFIALFVWLISHQPAVLFSQNKPATSNQPAVLFSQNKSAPAISREQAACWRRELAGW
jgi:hypothetical protein